MISPAAYHAMCCVAEDVEDVPAVRLGVAEVVLRDHVGRAGAGDRHQPRVGPDGDEAVRRPVLVQERSASSIRSPRSSRCSATSTADTVAGPTIPSARDARRERRARRRDGARQRAGPCRIPSPTRRVTNMGHASGSAGALWSDQPTTASDGASAPSRTAPPADPTGPIARPVGPSSRSTLQGRDRRRVDRRRRRPEPRRRDTDPDDDPGGGPHGHDPTRDRHLGRRPADRTRHGDRRDDRHLPRPADDLGIADRGAGGVTSPEELLAAAHASCFSMACSNILAKAGTPVERLDGRGRRHRRPARRRLDGASRRRSPSAATCRARPRSRSPRPRARRRTAARSRGRSRATSRSRVEATLEG